MSEQPEELDFEERRKRLEQLFAADPHLSPTMRARQLTEEASVQNNGHSAPINTTPPVPVPIAPLVQSTAPLVQSTAPAAQVEIVDDLESADSAIVTVDDMINLAEARNRLRSGNMEGSSLQSFRDATLSHWRRDIYSDR